MSLIHEALRAGQAPGSQREQPVHGHKVAQFAAELAALLPSSRPGTRVVPPELVWEAAQTSNVNALAAHWLSGQPLPETPPRPVRM